MKNSFILYAAKSNLCFARQEPMAPRVQARLDIVGEDYVKKFWVGLLEGDGTMGVKLNSKKKDFRNLSFAIEMNYTPETEIMLHAVAAVVGGYIAIGRVRGFLEGKVKYPSVKWKAESKENVARVLEILKTYPPLTTKSRARRNLVQLVFDQKFIRNKEGREVFDFVNNERKKLLTNRHLFALKDYNVDYIEPWLVGFMEAECNWYAGNRVEEVLGVTKARDAWATFSIKQKNEKPLLKFMGEYFGYEAPNLYPDKNETYELKIMSRASLKLRHNHVHANPFLGYKGVQFENFFELVRNRKTNKIDGEYIRYNIPEDSLFVKIRKDPIIYAPPLTEKEEANLALRLASLPVKKQKKTIL